MRMDYQLLFEQAKAITEGESDLICNLANLSALLFSEVDRLNWAGFYLHKDGELVLGPFQGKVACRRIQKGKGVCGTAWREGKSQLVENVHAFPGHIACDGASNSEIVVSIVKNGAFLGVLDLDSPFFSRFGEEDLIGLERIAEYISELF
ncbi:MAG: GAF domain-containing protein [Clostridia bacterium]|nr:GAF domain-containing protein [Clostridia bacterium]